MRSIARVLTAWRRSTSSPLSISHSFWRTVVAPYLCYSRSERRTRPRDPVTTRYLAALFEAVGTDCVVTLDVHDLAAFQNAFRCRTEHLEAKNLFARYIAPLLGGRAAVMSPDAGGYKRAEAFRKTLSRVVGSDLPMVFMAKQRSDGGVSGGAVVGDVAGRAVVILDDLVSTGTTLCRAVRACREHDGSGCAPELQYRIEQPGSFAIETDVRVG